MLHYFFAVGGGMEMDKEEASKETGNVLFVWTNCSGSEAVAESSREEI